MNVLKNLFSKREKTLENYEDFWNWFATREQQFFTAVKSNKSLESDFFNQLSTKLEQIKPGIWFLCGMQTNEKVELILTADGVICNIVFVEELIAAAPSLKNWVFTALKQPSKQIEPSIAMEGYKFDGSTMHFYSEEHPEMPDKIHIIVTHSSLNDVNTPLIVRGVYLAIDNWLGELNAITTIDYLDVIHPSKATKELIPIDKLKSFLVWREKEFVERYKDRYYDLKSDKNTLLEGVLSNGLPVVALINKDILNWKGKTSHPWIARIDIGFKGNEIGMPAVSTQECLTAIENELTADLKANKGYLYIGRQTADSIRTIYFSCIDFRFPSKRFHALQKKHDISLDINFDIYKDKYWETFNRFSTQQA